MGMIYITGALRRNTGKLQRQPTKIRDEQHLPLACRVWNSCCPPVPAKTLKGHRSSNGLCSSTQFGRSVVTWRG